MVGRPGWAPEGIDLERSSAAHPSVMVGEAATATIVTASDEEDYFEADFRT